MKEEKSCGAVVVKIEKGKVFYLIEKMNVGHYSLPKGHVIDGETELETAKREIKEETNLDVIFYHGFREVVFYHPYEDVEKEVVFFMAETYDSKNMKPQTSEVTELLFLPYEEALNLLTYETDKRILQKAHIFNENYGDEGVFH